LIKKHLRFGRGFRVIPGNRGSQAAEMVLEPGDAEGDRGNRHRGADQWLYVLSGSGEATVNGRRHPIRRGSLLFIERREKHEIKNTGKALLRTLNLYAPPAYRKDGNPLPRGKR
jgi:mannose-6-phosphate isomerase-like protein (cupin superfamily)